MVIWSMTIAILLFTILVLVSTPAFPDPTISLELLTSNLDQPVFLTHDGDGSGRLFIVEQSGRIRILKGGKLLVVPFLDIQTKVTSEGELGLLGLAFHPDFSDNRRFFLNYTREFDSQIQTVITEYRASQSNPDVAEPQEKVILGFDQPFTNHNGGMLAFGPDGLLYIGTGDGGSGGDPFGNAQDTNTLLGKILRIEVDEGDPYGIPSDNPFVGEVGTRGEIWAYGLRNPWRFSFDRSGGRLFAGDVGQNDWEEIDLIPRGGNLGWNVTEGNHCFPPGVSQCETSGQVLPIGEYDRSEGGSVTGGYVYRGLQQTTLWGSYLFGDFATGRIWALTERVGGVWEQKELLRTGFPISSFGEDEKGEIYVLDYSNGRVHRIGFGWRELLAQVADGKTPVGRVQSVVFVVNTSDQELSGALQFISGDGLVRSVSVNGAASQTIPVMLGPKSAIALRTDGTSNPLFAGWAELKADARFNASGLLVLRSPAEEALAEAGVGSSPLRRDFSAFVSREFAFDMGTALAIANPSQTEGVSVEVTLRELGGVALSKTFELGPREQIARFIEEIGDLNPDFEDTANVSATSEVIVTVLRTKSGIHSASLPAGH